MRDVTIMGQQISGTYTDGGQFQTFAPDDPALVQNLSDAGVRITAQPLSENFSLFFGADFLRSDAASDRGVDLLHASDAGRCRRQGHGVRQVESQAF